MQILLMQMHVRNAVQILINKLLSIAITLIKLQLLFAVRIKLYKYYQL